MVVVKIEIWPGGDESRKRDIGRVDIANDGTGTFETGNYNVRLYHAGRFWGRPGFWKVGEVKDYDRQRLSPYHLVAWAIKNALNL
jgi:hypothetical protein